MKNLKVLLSLLAAAAVTSTALGQQPGGTNGPPPRSDDFPLGPWGTNMWWTNFVGQGTAPPSWTNAPPRVVPPQPAPGSTPQAPPDVKAVVARFQQTRDQLVNQLKNSSDAQRQQILQQYEQIRQQQRDQMMNLRQQARDQANQMRNSLGNPRDNLLNQGVGQNASSGQGTPGKPRN